MTTPHWLLKRPRLWGLLCGLTLAIAQFFVPAGMGSAQAATTNCTPNGLAQDCTVTFAYSGAAETWTVPDGVTQATFDLYGAQGGYSPYGGKGGRVMATLTVIPGATYQLVVGGNPTGSSSGFNGGGRGGTTNGGGGGGASDVRTGAFALANRILVAGAGGGGSSTGPISGGAGGYPNGAAGAPGGSFDADGGGGAAQTAGGAGGAGTNPVNNGGAGSLGQGGNGGSGGYSSGGGGGYYGGGGGGVSAPGTYGGGGGGGSSFGPTGATFQNGVRDGNGQIIISYTQSDKLAPVANPTQSPPAAPSGWNNTTVTVTWNWTDPSPSAGLSTGIDPANCTTSSVSSGSGIINLSATCKDLAGNVGTATYRVLVDPTAPTANPSQSPAANADGWNNSDVTVNWNWVSTGAIIDTANCTTSSTSSGEGTLTLSATCKDVATNQRTATYQVKVDKTAPIVTVTGVSNGAVYTVGSVPISGCSTADALSGVATQATLSVTGGNPDGTGSFTATCSSVTDNASNSAAPVSVSYTVSAPTATNTAVPPTATNTAVPPTATNTAVPPTATPTNTPVSPTATNTPVPPTATNTAVPPTATNTAVPPTATPQATLPASLYATVQQVRSSLAALLPSGDSKTDQALQKAIAKLDQGLSPNFWQLPDGNHLSDQGEKAFHRLRDAIKELCKLGSPPAAVTSAIATLTGVGRTLAEQAITEATAAGGNAKQISKANKELAKAQKDLAKQRPDLAFSHYEEAWETAQAAMGVILAASEPDEATVADDPADADPVHDEVDDDSAADPTTVVQQIFLPLITR